MDNKRTLGLRPRTRRLLDERQHLVELNKYNNEDDDDEIVLIMIAMMMAFHQATS